jgi:hypothetical protein
MNPLNSKVNNFSKSLGLAYSRNGSVQYVPGFNRDSAERLYTLIQERKGGDQPLDLRLQWIIILVTLYKKTTLADKNRVISSLNSAGYKNNIIQKIATLAQGISRESIVESVRGVGGLSNGPLKLTENDINKLFPA